jgi:hypothetical protein
MLVLRTSLLLIVAMGVHAAEIPLTVGSRLELVNAKVETTTHRGATAFAMSEKDPGPNQAFAIVKDLTFHDGTIEVEVAGAPSKTADATARGFIGVAFRMAADQSRYEMIYIRPSNGRADDQLMRNHSTQYVSAPDWPWQRLRKETPGQYESYVDLQPGEWVRMRIVVKGTDAFLYVGEASQPCLVVHNMKLGDSQGAVALWIGPGTEGYFRGLKISQ